jgi:3-methyladenine DNA glycosylase Tag
MEVISPSNGRMLGISTQETEGINTDLSLMLSKALIDRGVIKIPKGIRYAMQEAISCN